MPSQIRPIAFTRSEKDYQRSVEKKAADEVADALQHLAVRWKLRAVAHKPEALWQLSNRPR